MMLKDGVASETFPRNVLQKTLSRFWGHSSFRPLQAEAIIAVLRGLDVLLILPTGGGKSLAFQLPALTKDHALTVVVSPLIALAKDQADRCLSEGIEARIWSSETSEAEKCFIEKDVSSEEPELRLIYTTPESIQTPRLLQCLQVPYSQDRLMSFAIDESHCISQWGHDFRPAYLQLSSLRQSFVRVPILAATATATKEVQSSIKEILQLRNPVKLQQSFNRANLEFNVRFKDQIGNGSDNDVIQEIVSLIKSRAEEDSGILYCQYRKTCETVATALCNADIDAAAYHAGKASAQRTKVQQEWRDGSVQVICATIAFGMGIDKPDVRWVIHFSPSKSIEGYYQEAGRAGRDGLPSICILYTSDKDVKELGKLERGYNKGSVEKMEAYCRSKCRRRALLGFLGEMRGACQEGEQLCDSCKRSRDERASPNECIANKISRSKLKNVGKGSPSQPGRQPNIHRAAAHSTVLAPNAQLPPQAWTSASSYGGN